MKNIILSFIIFTTVLAASAQTSSSDLKPASAYLPEVIWKNTPLTMSLNDFIAYVADNKKTMEMNENSTSRITYVEKAPYKGIKEITYYFLPTKQEYGATPIINAGKMFEMIIEFEKEEDRDKVVNQLLGKPNNKKEWRHATSSGYYINAWKFDAKVVYVAAISGTSYY